MMLAQAFRKPLLGALRQFLVGEFRDDDDESSDEALDAPTAGGRNVMVATGQDDEPPAPGMHWLFASAMWSRELDELRPASIARSRIRRGSSMPAVSRPRRACRS